MELTSYLIQIIISVGIFTILCFIVAKLKKIILKHNKFDLNEYFPIEEILTLKQVYYLILIFLIYFCIMNFFLNKLHPPGTELIIINSIIDIIFSVYITIDYYDGSTRSKIISIFLIPLSSISFLLFGESLILYWDFIRIPTLLYLVVHYYNKFSSHTQKNNLDRLILLLISILYICLIFTLIVENQNPINAFAMVSNALTSNGYVVLGESTIGVLVSTFLVWSGYIISGVATASLAAAIVQRNSNKKFERLENKIDNLEKILSEYKKGE